MTIAAKVSSTEIDSILRDRFLNQYFEARLINLPAYTYTPGTAGADSTLLAGEVTLGTGGYQRSIVAYGSSDIGGYADGGIALTQKASTFAQDGSATPITFSHIALVWSTGNAITLGGVTSVPASATTTTSAYTNIPTTTSGSGVGLTVDLEVTNSGATSGDYVVTLNKPGYGYAVSDTVTVANGVLAGLDPSVGAGDLVFSVATVYTPSIASAGDLFTVAKTASTVNLVDGNEAAFYWNVKQFGFYTGN